MSKYRVQFQKGMSLQQFLHEFGSEEQCRRAVFQMRWPNDFRCPSCGHHSHCQLHTRALIECHRCHHQTSLTAGTVMAHTKLPLTQWFLALYLLTQWFLALYLLTQWFLALYLLTQWFLTLYLLTQSKTGISAMELKRHLGVRYPTAWLLKQKLMQTMRERDDETPLSGQVQVDDAFWGGERRGGKRGHGAAGKTPFGTVSRSFRLAIQPTIPTGPPDSSTGMGGVPYSATTLSPRCDTGVSWIIR